MKEKMVLIKYVYWDLLNIYLAKYKDVNIQYIGSEIDPNFQTVSAMHRFHKLGQCLCPF